MIIILACELICLSKSLTILCSMQLKLMRKEYIISLYHVHLKTKQKQKLSTSEGPNYHKKVETKKRIKN